MKVNTLIIGAGRSGTTSVYAYLAAHPEVNFSITKELHYFSIDDLYRRGEKYLHSLFESANKKIIATADTYLLMDTVAPERVQKYNSEMKIIVMLRDPVDRAYSNYLYSVNFGHEDKSISFLETLQLEKERLLNSDIVYKNNNCHFYGSLYYKHLQFWGNYFPPDQFIIIQLKELKSDPAKFYQNLCYKLGIEYIKFAEEGTKFNAASGVKSKRIQQLLLNRNSNLRKALSFILRPFRNRLIKSGLIEKVYALNKKDVAQINLRLEEREQANQYFEKDLQLLKSEFGIHFDQEIMLKQK